MLAIPMDRGGTPPIHRIDKADSEMKKAVHSYTVPGIHPVLQVRTYGWLAIHFHFSVRFVVPFSRRIDGTAFVIGVLQFQFGRNLTDKCRSVFQAFDGQKALSRKLSNTVSSSSDGIKFYLSAEKAGPCESRKRFLFQDRTSRFGAECNSAEILPVDF